MVVEKETRATGAGRAGLPGAVPAARRIAFAGAFRVAAALACVAAAAPAAAQDVGLPLGTVPEGAAVQDLDGNPVELGDYIGQKPLLLEFWATWCPLCRAMEPRLEAAHQRFGDRVDFIFVGVAVNQTPWRIRRHLEDHPLPGQALYDARGAATRAFMAPTTSYIVILDGDGKVVYTGTGADQDIMAPLERVAGG
jgi:thiol-disulfide isomerase/thioredoxin